MCGCTKTKKNYYTGLQTTTDTIFGKFKKVKCISTLDLRSRYWQVPLAKESREPCSFLINSRNYSYKRLPFDLNISGAELFQKSTDTVLGSLTNNFVTIYVDDILITSEDSEKHYNHIKQVLQKFRDYNITVNLEKCQFFRQDVLFLGHIITTNGIKMDPEKTKSIQEFEYKYIKTGLAQGKSPPAMQGQITADTPFGNLSNNQLRKAIYRAAMEKSNNGVVKF